MRRAAFGEIQIGGDDTGKPLNRRKRLGLLARWVDLDRARLLDCGCGSGEFVAGLEEWGSRALGVEYSVGKVVSASLAGRGNGRIVPGDLARLPFAAGSFDAVLLNEVLEHVPDERGALREIQRVLAPGGLLVVFSPNRCYPFEIHGVEIRSSGRRLPISVPFVPWVPLFAGRRLFRYLARNYWPWELRRLLKEAGFAILRTGYVWQTFENISGQQPAAVTRLRSVLRWLAARLERLPGARVLGISQLVVARRPAGSERQGAEPLLETDRSLDRC